MSPRTVPLRKVKTALPAGDSVWSSVRGETLSSRITQQIRTALFAGQIKPGEALGSEKTLAARFGVSRMAMRDALRSLEAAGIVDIKVGAKGGVFIARGNHMKFADALAIQLKLVGVTVEEMFDSQIAIEVTAAEFAAKRATPDDLQKLRDLLDELKALSLTALLPKGASRFTTLAMQFHEALVDTAHNRALSAQFRALRLVLEPVYARGTTSAVARRVVSAHQAVYDCIETGDGERASALLRKRLETIRSNQLGAADR
jgi:GntR family transcriptional repressor for pyruvate dehydrogenase complex